MQWGQACGLESLAFRPVGGLQVVELLLCKWFVVRSQRVQASLLAVVQMSNQTLPREELDSTCVAKARARIQPGRPVNAM